MRFLRGGAIAVMAAAAAAIPMPAEGAIGASAEATALDRTAQQVSTARVTYCNRQPGEIIADPVGCALDVYGAEMSKQRCYPAIPTVDETAYCSSIGAETGKPIPVPGIGDPVAGVVDGASMLVSEDGSCSTRSRSGICAGAYRVNAENSAYCYNHYTGPSDFCSDKNGDGDHKFGPWHHLTSTYSGGGGFDVRVYVFHENGANQHLASGYRRADTGWFGGRQWLNGRVWQGDNNRHTIHGHAER